VRRESYRERNTKDKKIWLCRSDSLMENGELRESRTSYALFFSFAPPLYSKKDFRFP
jgi:hypothetical protein